jgi:hypothetical protein
MANLLIDALADGAELLAGAFNNRFVNRYVTCVKFHPGENEWIETWNQAAIRMSKRP